MALEDKRRKRSHEAWEVSCQESARGTGAGGVPEKDLRHVDLRVAQRDPHHVEKVWSDAQEQAGDVKRPIVHEDEVSCFIAEHKVFDHSRQSMCSSCAV